MSKYRPGELLKLIWLCLASIFEMPHISVKPFSPSSSLTTLSQYIWPSHPGSRQIRKRGLR